MSDLEHDAYDTEPTELSRDERRLRDADDALDAAGVPRIGIADLELSAADRVRRLAGQRDERELEREGEAKEANRWAGEAREATSIARRRGSRLLAIEAELDRLGVPVAASDDDRDPVVVRVSWLATERDQLRKMHDGVSADLDRERREHQEAMGEAAARELKLTEERDDARRHRASFMDQRDAALARAKESSRRYNAIADERQRDVDVLAKARELADNAEGWRLQCAACERTIARLRATGVDAALREAGVPVILDSAGNRMTLAGRVKWLAAQRDAFRAKTKKTTKKTKKARRS